MKTFISIILLLATIISAQVEQKPTYNPYNIGPNFYMDLVNYKGSSLSKTRLDIFLQVPYSNMQFVKKGSEFKAGYSVTLTFYDEDEENILFERYWSENIKVNEFDKTSTKSGHNLSYRSIEMTPGKYAMKCLIEDKDSKKNVLVQSIVNIFDFSDTVEVSDIVLISQRVNTKDGEQIIPNVANVIHTDNKQLDFFFEVYSNSNKDVFFEYIIEDVDGETFYKHLLPHKLEKGANVVYHKIDNPNISLGVYRFIIQVESEEKEVIASSTKQIRSKISGFPDYLTDLDVAIEHMVYIASSSEIDFIEDTEDPDDKLKRFQAFWQEKDPSDNTAVNEVLIEYYRRVNFANTNFKSYFEGWQTDMGMIYITLGPPNQVDRHPFDYDSKPYEVWDYYEINKRFVFTDQTGFGDYRLQNPVYGDWYRYRY